MTTNNEPKESEYTNYAITPIKYYWLTGRPRVKIDGHCSVLKDEKSCWTKYRLEYLTGTDDRRFYNDLEEIVATMEHEKEIFENIPFLNA